MTRKGCRKMTIIQAKSAENSEIVSESVAAMSGAVSRREVLRGLVGFGALAAVSVPGVLPKQIQRGLAARGPLSGSPRRGGDLRLGTIGGSSSDTLDADNAITFPDWARNYQLYEGLNEINAKGEVVLQLAEEISPSADRLTWTIRVRDGVLFSNGKPLGAEDVAFTLNRILNKRNPLPGAVGLAPVDTNSFKILDRRTLQLKTAFPYSSLPDNLAAWYVKIVPVGYNPKAPVGTGPFMARTFVPGVKSLFVRNPHYWQEGLPYLDSVSIVEFSDDNARLNALLSGVIDAMDQVPTSLVAELRSNKDVVVSVSPSGAWRPFTMRVDVAPFSDVRVRQAMRLIVNRPEMGTIANGGYFSLGNDIFARYDPAYDKALPQRHQDIAQAKALLRRAGYEKLRVQLTTADIAPSVNQASLVLQEQARLAGVTIDVKTVSVSSFYGPGYTKYPFAVDTWFYTPYLAQLTQGMLPSAPFNETHWDDPAYNALYKQAIESFSEAKRIELIHEMQTIEYNSGGLIIATFPDSIDAWRSNVQGLESGVTGLGLGNYNFKRAWLT